MTRFLSSVNAIEWACLKLPVRARLAAACHHLLTEGSLNRADVMRLGEVSEAQAAIDLRTIRDRAPGFMYYDASAKCYRTVGRSMKTAGRKHG